METRRTAMKHILQWGLAAATTPIWCSLAGRRALGQSSTTAYKAVVVITLVGGNDTNNIVIPLDPAEYVEYSKLRSTLALAASSIIPISTTAGSSTYGLHPSLRNVAALYGQKRAAIVANIGPLAMPATKAQLSAASSLYPQSLFSHPAGRAQWESASTVNSPATGWGGRIADSIAKPSDTLPPVLNTASNSIFSTGALVQAVAVQSGGAYAALPSDMNATLLALAQHDAATTSNKLAAAIASFQATAMAQQVVLDQAKSYSPVKQTFTSTPLGVSLKIVAQLLAGRSVIGSSRQLFYAQQADYDTHQKQLAQQGQLLADLDTNLGTFFEALDDLGLSNDVLVCTHSDFSRTMTCNVNAGSDHAWGSHQLILGGGIAGGRIIGSMPILELGGPDDVTQQGIWIPSLSVTQMTGAIGGWLGLGATDLAGIFPDLANFPSGVVQL